MTLKELGSAVVTARAIVVLLRSGNTPPTLAKFLREDLFKKKALIAAWADAEITREAKSLYKGLKKGRSS